MLASTLERRGIGVLRKDLSPPMVLKILWRYTFGILHKVVNPRTSYDFYRSWTNWLIVTWLLNRLVKCNSANDTILINLSISHSPSKCDIPVILISDWSYDHYIREFLGRKPDLSERRTIIRDRVAMLRASLNVLLFPKSTERLKYLYPEGKFKFISHILNVHPEACLPSPPIATDEVHSSTPHSPLRIVIIGRRKYLSALLRLKDLLKFAGCDLPLMIDIIGIHGSEQDVFDESFSNVRFHGYLRKGVPGERSLYYSLLSNADVFMNLTEVWGPVSATFEAMFFYTSVISPPYDELVALFGEKPAFCRFINPTDLPQISGTLTTLHSNRDILTRQKLAAREASESHTWDRFVDELLDVASSLR
jgi:glycosyltransferase involved in cell wall biosynthesis